MKKILTAIIVILGFYSASFAQQQKGDVELGVNVGYNYSTVTNDQATNSSYRNAFNLGIAADLYFSDRWSLKAKVIYDQKGWDNGFIIDDNNNSTITNFQLNYITVPVMANWHFGRTRNWYLNFGPYVGFLTSAKETALNTDVKSFFQSTDAGLAVGIGTKIPLSDKVKLAIEYDDQAGISDIAKGNNSGSAYRNDRGSFNIGFDFAL